MEPSRTLFALRTPCRWFPDETLFSLCSRHHRLSGNVSAARTSLEMFGPAHDRGARFGGLEALSARADGQLGTARSIVDQRTLHPFYQAFLPAKSAGRVVDAMLSGTPGGLRHALDCDLDGPLPRHALRACLQCAQEDLATKQVAYWHRNHQWPGVYRCHRHAVPLLEVLQRPMHERGFAWLLPSIQAMEEALATATATVPGHPAPARPIADILPEPLHEQARWGHRAPSKAKVQYFVPMPFTIENEELIIRRHAATALGIGRWGHRMRLEGWLLAELYRVLLSRRGLNSDLRGLSTLSAAGDDFQSFALPMLHLREIAGQLETKEQAREHVRRLCTAKRMPRDAVWHLLAITWLAKDWDVFLRQYEAIAKIRGSLKSADFWNKPLSI